MKRLLAWLAGTLLLVLATGGLLLMAVDSQPLVSRSETISPLSVAQARSLLLSNDPRHLRSGEARRTAVPAALLDDGFNYAATRFLRGRGALILAGKNAEIRLTRRLPLIPGEYYLNLSAMLHESNGEPHIASARIGSLPLPPGIIEMLLGAGIRLAGYEREGQLARQAIRELRFDAQRQRVIVAYVWQAALLERARSIAVNPDELVRIRTAHERLAALLAHRAPGSRVALPEILGPMLTIQEGAPREERRAAIFVLAAYLSEKNLASFIPEAATWAPPQVLAPTLFGRLDSAQHFVISAALAAWAGEPIADAIGLYKELADARLGSGFSFADLLADRAGTRFGEILAAHPERLDKLLSRPFTDDDLVPGLNNLPAAMHEHEFQRRFGDPSNPAYQQLIAEIERRISVLPLYAGATQ